MPPQVDIALYSCSPRPHGNSDKAAGLMAKTLKAEGAAASIHYLRQFNILPCQGCNRCEHDPHGRCFLSSEDQSGQAFAPLLEAKTVLFASPIYFYHLPAVFKGFVDRSQSFYNRWLKGNDEMRGLPKRRGHVVLIAGRDQGERLFEGSLLTLRYFLRSFNIELAEPLLLRGLDHADDLAQDEEACLKVREYARQALTVGDAG